MAKKKSRLTQALTKAQIQHAHLEKQKKLENLRQAHQKQTSNKSKPPVPRSSGTQKDPTRLVKKDGKGQAAFCSGKNHQSVNQSSKDVEKSSAGNPLLAKMIEVVEGGEDEATLEESSKGSNGQPSKPVAPPKPHACMVGLGDRVLLVGEGNFSFTLSLVLHHSHPGHLLTATTNDSRSTVLSKYPESSELLATLESRQVTLLFELDGCKLHQDKRIRNQRFDRVVFNFPHVGGSEPDQDRSIRQNQIMLLKFLRSVACVLYQLSEGEREKVNMLAQQASSKASRRKRKREPLRSEANSDSEEEGSYRVEDGEDESRLRRPGTVLITLGNCVPYTLWELPMLAKRGTTLAHSILYPTHPHLNTPRTPQPTYRIIRSSDFKADAYPGYQHRRTAGLKSQREAEGSQPLKARTWEFELDL